MNLSLIVFAASGRIEELRQTLASIEETRSAFAQLVLSLDGYDAEMVALAQDFGFDQIVVSYKRAGYFASIQRAFALVSQPFFFWLEDDWVIHGMPSIERILGVMGRHDELAQVRLRRDAKVMPRDLNRGAVEGDIAVSSFLYHLHPHIGRTRLLREFCCDLGFQEEAKGHNVEDAITEWLRRREMLFGLVHDGVQHCEHIGKHSSIAPGQRQYHDIWSGEEIAVCASGDAEQKLRRLKGQSRLVYANDRHDVRRRRVVLRLLWDYVRCLLVFPFVALSLPFHARARQFIREMAAFWFR